MTIMFSCGLHFAAIRVMVYPRWHQILGDVSHRESHCVVPTQCGNSLINTFINAAECRLRKSVIKKADFSLWHQTNSIIQIFKLKHARQSHWVTTFVMDLALASVFTTSLGELWFVWRHGRWFFRFSKKNFSAGETLAENWAVNAVGRWKYLGNWCYMTRENRKQTKDCDIPVPTTRMHWWLDQ